MSVSSEQWSRDIFASVPPVAIKKWADPSYDYSLAKGSKIPGGAGRARDLPAC